MAFLEGFGYALGGDRQARVQVRRPPSRAAHGMVRMAHGGVQQWEAFAILRESKLVLCVREKEADVETILEGISAAIRGGVRAIEVTSDTKQAWDIVRRLKESTNALVGIGTVLTSEEVRAAQKVGADFVMSPVSDAEIIRLCEDADLLMLPGGMTATEIYGSYYKLGAHAVKVYPFNACGATQFISAMCGPFPNVPVLPTSGVRLEELEGLLKLRNVLAVGFSKQVLSSEILRSRDWGKVELETKRWVDVAKESPPANESLQFEPHPLGSNVFRSPIDELYSLVVPQTPVPEFPT